MNISSLPNQPCISTSRIESFVSDTPSQSVFLGGTCGDSQWRSLLRSKLPEVLTTDPSRIEWSIQNRRKLDKIRKQSALVVYVFTPPIRGVYSFIELSEDAAERPLNTAICLLESEGDTSLAGEARRQLEIALSKFEDLGVSRLEDLQELSNWIRTRMEIA